MGNASARMERVAQWVSLAFRSMQWAEFNDDSITPPLLCWDWLQVFLTLIKCSCGFTKEINFSNERAFTLAQHPGFWEGNVVSPTLTNDIQFVRDEAQKILCCWLGQFELEMSPIGPRHLNTWFPVGDTIWRGVGSVASLDEVYHWVTPSDFDTL